MQVVQTMLFLACKQQRLLLAAASLTLVLFVNVSFIGGGA
jgi:hypothetical protein